MAERDPASFADHFSGVAHAYARSRPHYPEALFDWLAQESPDRDCAWDCAAGNGQAAAPLARRFAHVIATDGSRAQLREATRGGPRVRYAAGLAESAPLAPRSVDCITVAQAAHWFDLPRFFAEVERIARPGALLALWCYALMTVEPEVDAVIDRLYREVVGPYWPARRLDVDSGYRGLQLPFPELIPPRFTMSQRWTLHQLRAYIGTWSASQAYRSANGEDPLATIDADLRSAWGEPEAVRVVTWPLHTRAARVARSV